MIIGAEKAGTTSLLRYLGQHPRVYTHSQREMTFFVQGNQYEKGIVEAYSRFFPAHRKGQLIFYKEYWDHVFKYCDE